MTIKFNIAGYNQHDYEKVVKSDFVNSSLMAKVLASRNICENNEIHKFVQPNLDRDWKNPYEIDGMEDVVNVVEQAIRGSKHILIYGDYDLDGISSIAVMILGLKAINEHAKSQMQLDYFIPDRFEEGYGFSDASIERMIASKAKPDLIITVDCGITADREIKILEKKGINFVVTDHHEKSDNFPIDNYVIDPKAQENEVESANLAGVGVALKLIQVLGSRFGMPHVWQNFVDLGMLGTVADIMPLIGENRALVAEGLKMLNSRPRPCLKALIDVAGKSNQKFSSIDLSFSITPRLNSAGRMNKPELAVDLLLCDNYVDAYNIAVEIENLNNERKEITEQIVEKASYCAEKILENNPQKRSLVLYDENWHDGVRGIVAAKIADKFQIPTIVFSRKDNWACGSGRSFGQIDLHEACIQAFDKFVKFGGHKGACGATIELNDLQEFSNKLENYMQKQNALMFSDSINADFEIKLHELDYQGVAELSKLEPLGCNNEEPRFLINNVFIKKGRAVGKNADHLSCYISDGASGTNAIMFFVEDIAKYLQLDSMISVIARAKTEEYQSRKFVKLYLEHILTSKEIAHNNSTDENNMYLENLYGQYAPSCVSQASVGDFIANSIYAYNNQVVQDKQDISSTKSNAGNKAHYKTLNKEELLSEVLAAMIGKDGQLHPSQQEALDILNNGKSALAVMPTGRGKSLIFQVYATILAIKEGKTSLFVYPLRALISDQAYHLSSSLEKFGLNIKVINGETSEEDRQEIYRQMRAGYIDIVLTTPEYLSIHVQDFVDNAEIGFVVIDESHHLGEVRIGQRTAYGHMPKILEKLNYPQVLALSATVSDEIFTEIQKYLPITEMVKDDFERENLYVDDRRNLKCRDDYLASLVASGQKCLVYVNSRQQTIDLARMIKSRAPHVALKVGFYNAGMTKEDRKKIEQMFRNNQLSTLIATSAFGEGVNIPDVRHVCLYHLPFSEVEFNQMCGRCGRDNLPALVHLLYNRADATINTQILAMTNPNRDELGRIYKWIKVSCDNFGGGFSLNHQHLQDMNRDGIAPAAPAAIFSALDIFTELGFINVKTEYNDAQTYSTIMLSDNIKRAELEESSRYCEGLNEINSFNNYRHFAMRTSAKDLTRVMRHPIMPKESLIV